MTDYDDLDYDDRPYERTRPARIVFMSERDSPPDMDPEELRELERLNEREEERE